MATWANFGATARTVATLATIPDSNRELRRCVAVTIASGRNSVQLALHPDAARRLLLELQTIIPTIEGPHERSNRS